MGLTNQTVRSYIRSGKLHAERIGRAYLISEKAVLDYVKLSGKSKPEPKGWDIDTTSWEVEENNSWDIDTKTDWSKVDQ